MSDIIVRATNLTKVYRLYARPHFRFLDMLGLLRPGSGRYTEHRAVDRISLEVRRGEKVAVIGRNGAGKSTLLKLATRVIEPTSGRIEVAEGVHALLQIGSGFHPEFSGRENARSYLAHLGITGKDAEERIREIVEFAELEEYIDQPIKTYSTGMSARLMFATSTTVVPKLLVLDEILGVGDAYFAQKSYERIKTLCEREGATLLLVTHDLYSAMQICERCIGVDQGAVLWDADAKSVIHRYEASIRDQQEARLRGIHMKALEDNRRKDDYGTSAGLVFGQVRCEGNVPVDHDLPVAEIRILVPGSDAMVLHPGVATDGGAQLYVADGQHNWGEAGKDETRSYRCFTRQGSIYHRAPFVVEFDGKGLEQGGVEMEVEYKDLATTPCLVELFHEDGVTRSTLKLANKASGEWRRVRGSLVTGTTLEGGGGRPHRYGSQKFLISDIDFLGADGRSSHIFDIGDSMTIRMRYEIRDPQFRQRPVIQLNFLKDGTTRSHRFTLEGQLFDHANEADGTLEILASPMLLGPGTYLVNVVVMSEGGYARGSRTAFFTANPKLLDHHSRAYELLVRPSGNILADDVVFLHHAVWKRNGRVVYEGVYPLDPPAPAN